MGTTHRATGLCAGAYVAWGVRALTLPAPAPVWAVAVGVAALALLTAFAGRAALWPDFDHPRSTATYSFGLVTRAIHKLVCWFSCWMFDKIATPADVAAGDFREHRGVSHWGLTAVVVGVVFGVGTWLATQRWPVAVLGGCIGVSVTIVVDVVGRHRTAVLAGTVTAIAVWVLGPVALDWSTVTPTLALALGIGSGLATALGMLSHSVGDAATKTGAPLAAPFKIRGRRYYPVHIRRAGRRLHTGKSEGAELCIRRWCWALMTVAIVGWVPGLWVGLFSLIPWPV